MAFCSSSLLQCSTGTLFAVILTALQIMTMYRLCKRSFYLFVCCSGWTHYASDLEVRLGGILATDPEPDAVYAKVSHVIPHPDYNSTVLHNDIALLRLSSPVRFTDTILPICLPSSNVNLDHFKVCVDTGFGRTAFQGLQPYYFTFISYNTLSARNTPFL